jgi:hypothetical protein
MGQNTARFKGHCMPLSEVQCCRIFPIRAIKSLILHTNWKGGFYGICHNWPGHQERKRSLNWAYFPSKQRQSYFRCLRQGGMNEGKLRTPFILIFNSTPVHADSWSIRAKPSLMNKIQNEQVSECSDKNLSFIPRESSGPNVFSRIMRIVSFAVSGLL